jgi:hypothetical protein
MIHDFNLIFEKNNIHVFPDIDTCSFANLLLEKNNFDSFLYEDNNDIILLLSCCNLKDFITITRYFEYHSAYFFRVIMKANSVHFKEGAFYDCTQVFLNRLKFFEEYHHLDLIFNPSKIPFIQSLIKEGNYNYQFLLTISLTQWLNLFEDNSIFKPLINSIKEKTYLDSQILILNEEEIKIRKI